MIIFAVLSPDRIKPGKYQLLNFSILNEEGSNLLIFDKLRRFIDFLHPVFAVPSRHVLCQHK
jgi:hypothetical protein